MEVKLIDKGFHLEAFGKCFYYYCEPHCRIDDVEEILAQPMDAKLSSEIRQMNVLVVDDITCSGSTLNEILRSLQIVNDDNNITIFSLIGRKDLMADSF